MTTPSLTRYECYSKCSRRGRGEQNTIEFGRLCFQAHIFGEIQNESIVAAYFLKKKRNHYAVAIILEMSNEQSQ